MDRTHILNPPLLPLPPQPGREIPSRRRLHQVRREILVKLLRALKEPAAVPPGPLDSTPGAPVPALPGNILPFHHSNP